jgi:polyhydroxybutyrate depolymerase
MNALLKPGLLSLVALTLSLVASCSDNASNSGGESEDVAASDGDGGGTADADVDDSTTDEPQSDTNEGTSEALPDLTPPETPLGGDRPAEVFLPASYTPDRHWPLLMLLHGFGATGGLQDLYLGLSRQVDAYDFILVIPEGTTNGGGQQFWNATESCCDFSGSGVDDVGYLTDLIADTASRYRIDLDRVYLFGHSNGGFMSYRMACESGEEIAGILSLAGAMWADQDDCPGTSPVSVLQVHGTRDTTISYGNDGGRPGALESVERWVETNDCTPGGVQGDDIDIEASLAGAETTVDQWTNCDGGTNVALWSIEGGGHLPSFNSDFTPLALEWLLAQTRVPWSN